MECEFTGEQIEDYLIGRLAPLVYMDEYTIESALCARRERLERDWAEWRALDNECKRFLRDYLAGEENKQVGRLK